MKIWLLKDEGDFDTRLTAYRTKKAAKAALIALTKERWMDDMGIYGFDMPSCPEELIKEYNDGWDNSCLSIALVTLKD